VAARGLAGAAGHLVAAAHYPAAAAPHRVPADAHPGGIENREKTPAQTPWWLTLIRMAAAALVILALADPVLNPNSEKALSGSGPVVLVVDNGWAGAAQWQARTFMI